MTIKVKITHDQPGYDKSIVVETHDQDLGEVVDTTRVAPGESVELYVWGEQHLVVREASS